MRTRRKIVGFTSYDVNHVVACGNSSLCWSTSYLIIDVALTIKNNLNNTMSWCHVGNLRRQNVIGKDVVNLVILVLCLRMTFITSLWNKSGSAFTLGTDHIPLLPFGSDIAKTEFESTSSS